QQSKNRNRNEADTANQSSHHVRRAPPCRSLRSRRSLRSELTRTSLDDWSLPRCTRRSKHSMCSKHGVQRAAAWGNGEDGDRVPRGSRNLVGWSKIKSWSVLLLLNHCLGLHRARCARGGHRRLAERPPSIAWVRANRSAREQMCCARGRGLQRAVRARALACSAPRPRG